MASAIGASDWLAEEKLGTLAHVAFEAALVEVIWKFIVLPEVLTDCTWRAQELARPLPPGTGIRLAWRAALPALRAAR